MCPQASLVASISPKSSRQMAHSPSAFLKWRLQKISGKGRSLFLGSRFHSCCLLRNACPERLAISNHPRGLATRLRMIGGTSCGATTGGGGGVFNSGTMTRNWVSSSWIPLTFVAMNHPNITRDNERLV